MAADGRFWSPAHDRSAWGHNPLDHEWMAWEHGLESADGDGVTPLLWRDRHWRPMPMEPTYVPRPMLGDDPEWVEWVEDVCSTTGGESVTGGWPY
jgi:hypothetical protein